MVTAPRTPAQGQAKWSTWLATVAGLATAPCFIGVLLIPLVGGAVLTSAAAKFFDEWRFLFIGISLVFLGLSHWAIRRAGRKASAALWVVTAIVIVLIAGELYFDPPWDRHANIPAF